MNHITTTRDYNTGLVNDARKQARAELFPCMTNSFGRTVVSVLQISIIVMAKMVMSHHMFKHAKYSNHYAAMHYCIIHECHLNLLAHPPFLSPKKYIPLNYKNNFLQAFIIILAILKEACRGGDGVLAKTPSQQFLHLLCPSIS